MRLTKTLYSKYPWVLAMNISWSELRQHNNSQQLAFEELCCQLAAREDVPAGTKFIRLGTPDGGVEAYHILPNGDEHGWQAKYFHSLEKSQLGQLDSSVARALDTHPNLKRLTICMPQDLADPRGSRDSAMNRWNRRVIKWREQALQKGADINFERWGNFEIFDRLSRQEHRGRVSFWFNRESLTQEWFAQRAKEATADAGERFTAELNIELPIARCYESLARTAQFAAPFRKLQGSLSRATRQLDRAAVPAEITECKSKLLAATMALGKAINKTDFKNPGEIPAKTLALDLDAIELMLDQLHAFLWEQKRLSTAGKTDDLYSNARYDLGTLSGTIYQLRTHLLSSDMAIGNARCLLVKGSAGTGKTHLAVDVNRSRVNRGLPSVLILGQKFTEGEPLLQIVDILRFNGTPDEFLGALDAAAEAEDCLATILIDALNEGAGRVLWPSSLAGFLTAISEYPRIQVGLSIRSTYESLIPEQVKAQIVSVEHLGFGEKAFEALTRYFSRYSIKLPGSPPATTEFSNPLFLKLFCKGLHRRGIKEVPTGHEGITQIFSFYLDAVEQTLKQDSASTEPPHKELVGPYIGKLASEIAKSPETWIQESTAYDVSLECAPSLVGSNALLHQLLREDVLAKEMVYTDNGKSIEIVRFAYERLGDHALATSILGSVDGTEIQRVFAADGRIGRMLQSAGPYRFRGFIEAAMIQVPEMFGVELPEMLGWVEEYFQLPLEEAFLHSLIWRRPTAFSERTHESLRNLRYISNEEYVKTFLVLAARGSNPYNAEYLHGVLMPLSIAERDFKWTIPINQSYSHGSESDSLILWTRSCLDSELLDESSARLLALALTWLFSSTHRILRDKSTKSLANVLVMQPGVVPQLLCDFESCNDPCVTERLYAAVYGASMLVNESKVLQHWSLAILDQFTDNSLPVSILTRDYIRGTIERALAAGVDLPKEFISAIRPPYGSRWLRNLPSAEKFAAQANFYNNMSDADRVEASIYNQNSEDLPARYHGAVSLFVGMFSKTRLSHPAPLHPEKRLKLFESQLTNTLRAEFAEYAKLMRWCTDLKANRSNIRPGLSRKLITDDQIDTFVQGLQEELISILPRSLKRECRTFVVPYLSRLTAWPNDLPMGDDLVRRWVAHSTFCLGWTKKRFGDFDGYLLRLRSNGLEGRHDGLIAHKYRWIAYDEYLGRAADNFHLYDRWGDGSNVYDGPWQFHARNIDPSYIHMGRPDRDDSAITGLSPNLHEAVDKWLSNEDDVARVEDIVAPQNCDWVTLDYCPRWQEPRRPEEQIEYRDAYRAIAFWIHGYFVCADHVDEVCKFLEGVQFSNFNMPKGGELSNIFLGELFWSPAWRSRMDPSGGWGYEDWTRGFRSDLPHPVLATCWSYSAPDEDMSFDGSAIADVPAPWLAEAANLKWTGHLAEWADPNGVVVVRDVSMETGGATRLEIRKSFLESFLADRNLALIWTFQGEKILIDSSRYPRREMNGCYRYSVGGRVMGHYTATSW